MERWFPAYIGLGSNLDRPSRQIDIALERIAELPTTLLVKSSARYRSAPFGGVEQADFVNAAAAILTRLPAEILLRELQAIEDERGRVRDVRWGPRVIDLDLLVYSDKIIATESLTVPHPGIAERNFVLLPLLDIAPDLSAPGLGRLANIDVNMSEPAISRISGT